MAKPTECKREIPYNQNIPINSIRTQRFEAKKKQQKKIATHEIVRHQREKQRNKQHQQPNPINASDKKGVAPLFFHLQLVVWVLVVAKSWHVSWFVDWLVYLVAPWCVSENFLVKTTTHFPTQYATTMRQHRLFTRSRNTSPCDRFGLQEMFTSQKQGKNKHELSLSPVFLRK